MPEATVPVPTRLWPRRLFRLTSRGLLLALLVAVSFLYGYVSRRNEIPPHKLAGSIYEWARTRPTLWSAYHFVFPERVRVPAAPKGRWSRARAMAHPGADQEAKARLQSLGYLSGYEAPRGEGVTIYAPERAQNGLNFYVSGHAQQATLMDMRGNVLHSWQYRFSDAFPEHPALKNNPYLELLMGQSITQGPEFWRRAHLFANGDVLAIYDGLGMIKLDRNSRLLWANPAGFHHDLSVDGDGTIYALTRAVRLIPRIHPSEPILEDFISVVDSGGTILRELSLLDAFERSRYASFLDKAPLHGDMFHTNTIELLDGSHADRAPFLRRGNVLISLRNMNVIAVVDLDQSKVVWALSGMWIKQHQPTLLPSGNLLLFDNLGHHGMSKVIEFDPLSQDIVWSYQGDERNGFFSADCGSNQRLRNSNTLITETNSGRAFEVTADGNIVWEFYNPHRAGDNGELIASLLDLVRIEPAMVTDWLHVPASERRQGPPLALAKSPRGRKP